jgi:hypothetical protein
MTRAARYLLSAGLIAAGALLGLYGVFALLYRGEAGGGETTIELAGSTIDAHRAGAVSLAVSALLFACAYLAARGRRV